MTIRDFVPGEDDEVLNLCRQAFAGFPWFGCMSDEMIQERWRRHSSREGFCCLVAEIDAQIAGVSWFHIMAVTDLEKEKGRALKEFVAARFPGTTMVWIDATVTHPLFQGKGVAKRLKTEVFARILSLYPQVLILTRMRDDNTNIIRVNEGFGFLRTGVKVFGEHGAESDEFWYLPIGDKG